MSLLDDFDFSVLDIDTVVENSYRDFHAKGIDYICLHRSPDYTLKVYFFEDGQESSEVVNPHDHRYSFDTECLAGIVTNQWYHGHSVKSSTPSSEIYNMFTWHTPLLGGKGFTHQGEVQLALHHLCVARPGELYSMRSSEFHTIRVARGTAIVLAQYEDELPLNFPTLTFTKSVEPPDLTGLYNKFTADQVVRKIQEIKQLAGLYDLVA